MNSFEDRAWVRIRDLRTRVVVGVGMHIECLAVECLLDVLGSLV